MPQMKPMMWLMMLISTTIVLLVLSSITYFSYSDILPLLNSNYSQPLKNSQCLKKSNDK